MGAAAVGVIMLPRRTAPEPVARAPTALSPGSSPRGRRRAPRSTRAAACADRRCRRAPRARGAGCRRGPRQPARSCGAGAAPCGPDEAAHDGSCADEDPGPGLRSAQGVAGHRGKRRGIRDAEPRSCFEQGEIYRQLADATKSPEDWGAAADAFRKVVDQIGLGSARGQTAAYQLGWCECRRGDKKAAYEAFRRLCEAPQLVRTAAPTYRYQMATFALAAGGNRHREAGTRAVRCGLRRRQSGPRPQLREVRPREAGAAQVGSACFATRSASRSRASGTQTKRASRWSALSSSRDMRNADRTREGPPQAGAGVA